MISLCMIVKNEEHCLERCLNSAKDCIDEIIIVDTGSTDNTVNIAKEFGTKVFYYQWNDDFGEARNFSISKATGDWVLYLDADEELEPNCYHRFRALTDNPEIEGYYFQISNVNDNKDTLKHINVRMFRNKREYRFEGALHEQIFSSIQENEGRTVVVDSGINILHYGYTASEYINKNKGERNYRIIKKMLQDSPDDPFYLYNFGNCLINFNDIKGAAVSYGKALKNINLGATYAPSVFVAYIHCLLTLGKLEETQRIIKICKELYPDYVDIHFIEGEFYSNLSHLEKGKQCYEKCLSLGEHTNGKYTTRAGLGSYFPLFQLAQFHKNRGDIEKALYYQIQGLRIKTDNINNYITLAKLLKLHLKDNQRVFKILTNLVKHQNKTNEKLILGRMLNEIEAYDLAIEVLKDIPTVITDACFLKGLAFIRMARYNEAIQSFKQIIRNYSMSQTVLQELILAHWLSNPSQDASRFIQQANFPDHELYQTFKYINDMLFTHRSDLHVTIGSNHFKQLVDKILSLKQINFLLQILTVCGLDTPQEKINYLITAPVTRDKLELAAKMVLQELKKGLNYADYNFVLAWYFFNNDELDTALNILNKSIANNPVSPHYQRLLREIYLKQSLKIVLEALKNYPDNPTLNQYLITIQKDLVNGINLKGVH